MEILTSFPKGSPCEPRQSECTLFPASARGQVGRVCHSVQQVFSLSLPWFPLL
jgi:hypothetical protein